MSTLHSFRGLAPLHWAVVLGLVVAAATASGQPRPLTFDDLMHFRQIRQPLLSEDGKWLAYGLEPDRGDGEGVLRSADGQQVHRLQRGAEPQLSADGRWAAFVIKPTAAELEEAEKKGKQGEKDKKSDAADGAKAGMSLVDTRNGGVESYQRVDGFQFSDDGAWLAIHHFPAETLAAEDESELPSVSGSGEQATAESAVEPAAEGDQEDASPEPRGHLRLRHLRSGNELLIEQVREFAFDHPAAGEPAQFVAWVVDGPVTTANGLFVRPLRHDAESRLLAAGDKRWQGQLQWADEWPRLAFLHGHQAADDEIDQVALSTWGAGDTAAALRLAAGEVPTGWRIPSVNELHWSRDGERLFFGFRPRSDSPELNSNSEDETAAEPTAAAFDPFDQDALLEAAKVDVWHWDDPLISPHQKKRWQERDKELFRAVLHLDDGSVVQLADDEIPVVVAVDNPRFALGRSDVPYRKLITWEGRFYDYWAIDLRNGERRKFALRVSDDQASLSPGGGWVTWFQKGHWQLYSTATGVSRNLTESLEVPFANEDHDYSYEVPGYGVADWTADDQSLLLYDKFDIWQFSTDGGQPLRLTSGREERVSHRMIDLDERQEGLESDQDLLLLAYHDRLKHNAFVGAKVGQAGTKILFEANKRLKYRGRARYANRLLFTRESHAEFPDLWISDLKLEGRQRLSQANPQMADFGWGAPELVQWTSLDGEPLQGVLIKPAGYQEGQRYPVLVYFYRFFSQRLYEFNEPVINHRPSFPLYASDGYAVFLPDTRFEIGRPGLSATHCLVPGVQKLIEMGIADPQRIGLHGHSWSGYQAAFLVTQTDIFAAAVAGAPVSNMTSAYGGIRYTSGLARQFQYEQGQSRMGGSLWEKPWAYVENSPLFFADKIDTPLLIEFGDKDGAVPWTQGIELYLALRRLGKPAIFLQYRGEGHHLKKYANKLDYAIRMKAYFDHYLKGQPAAAWITDGEPYQGD